MQRPGVTASSDAGIKGPGQLARWRGAAGALLLPLLRPHGVAALRRGTRPVSLMRLGASEPQMGPGCVPCSEPLVVGYGQRRCRLKKAVSGPAQHLGWQFVFGFGGACQVSNHSVIPPSGTLRGLRAALLFPEEAASHRRGGSGRKGHSASQLPLAVGVSLRVPDHQASCRWGWH
jgi:hypothetical protein